MSLILHKGNRRRRRLVVLCALAVGAMALSACVSAGVSGFMVGVPAQADAQARFEQLLNSRGAECEALRQTYFADPALVAYLPERFDDADKVTAFIARQLHLWATDPPPEIAQTEEFLKVGILANRERMERTAGGWKPDMDLRNFLRDTNNQPAAAYFLMLHVLMQRDASLEDEVNAVISLALITYFWRPESIASDERSGIFPGPVYATLTEPEALIRGVLEDPHLVGFSASYADRLVRGVLPHVDRQRAIAAIEHERAYAQRHGRPFPQALIDYREQLRRGR